METGSQSLNDEKVNEIPEIPEIDILLEQAVRKSKTKGTTEFNVKNLLKNKTVANVAAQFMKEYPNKKEIEANRNYVCIFLANAKLDKEFLDKEVNGNIVITKLLSTIHFCYCIN